MKVLFAPLFCLFSIFSPAVFGQCFSTLVIGSKGDSSEAGSLGFFGYDQYSEELLFSDQIRDFIFPLSEVQSFTKGGYYNYSGNYNAYVVTNSFIHEVEVSTMFWGGGFHIALKDSIPKPVNYHSLAITLPEQFVIVTSLPNGDFSYEFRESGSLDSLFLITDSLKPLLTTVALDTTVPVLLGELDGEVFLTFLDSDNHEWRRVDTLGGVTIVGMVYLDGIGTYSYPWLVWTLNDSLSYFRQITFNNKINPGNALHIPSPTAITVNQSNQFIFQPEKDFNNDSINYHLLVSDSWTITDTILVGRKIRDIYPIINNSGYYFMPDSSLNDSICAISIAGSLQSFKAGTNPQWLYQSIHCFTGIDEVYPEFKSLSPNPVQNILIVRGTSPVEGQSFDYTIVNLQGKIMESGSSTNGNIDVSALPEGYYLLQIFGEVDQVVKPFIKH